MEINFQDKLILRQGRKTTELFVLDKNAFSVLNLLKLDPGKPAPIEPKTAIFTDGYQLGMVMLTDYVSIYFIHIHCSFQDLSLNRHLELTEN